MMKGDEARRLILSVLEDQALAVGGLVAVHDIPDQAIWDLMKTLDAIRRKALAQLGEVHRGGRPSPPMDIPEPHAAVEEFLRRLRES